MTGGASGVGCGAYHAGDGQRTLGAQTPLAALQLDLSVDHRRRPGLAEHLDQPGESPTVAAAAMAGSNEGGGSYTGQSRHVSDPTHLRSQLSCGSVGCQPGVCWAGRAAAGTRRVTDSTRAKFPQASSLSISTPWSLGSICSSPVRTSYHKTTGALVGKGYTRMCDGAACDPQY